MTRERRTAFIQALEFHQGNATDRALAAHLPRGKANPAAGAAAFAEALITAVRHVETAHGEAAADDLVEALSGVLRDANVTRLIRMQDQFEE